NLINSTTLRLGRRKKTMGFITTDIPLVIPLCGAISFGHKKPKRICSRVETLAINNSARSSLINFTGSLVKVTLLCRFKTPGALKNHVINTPYTSEIQAIRYHSVYPGVTNQ